MYNTTPLTPHSSKGQTKAPSAQRGGTLRRTTEVVSATLPLTADAAARHFAEPYFEGLMVFVNKSLNPDYSNGHAALIL